jgi:hypothetical protein
VVTGLPWQQFEAATPQELATVIDVIEKRAAGGD